MGAVRLCCVPCMSISMMASSKLVCLGLHTGGGRALPTEQGEQEEVPWGEHKNRPDWGISV